MSKITIIEGDLIEEIGGSYKIYAQEGYEIHAGKEIIFNAKEGIKYGEPKYPPGPEIPAKCVVHFRPKDGWKGEDYGFDWMRLGETSHFGDTYYKDLVAEQYKEPAFLTLETDINEDGGYFKESPYLFGKLRNEYGVYSIPWKKKSDGSPEDYFCSWLSLYPSLIKDKTENIGPSAFTNTKALLSLMVEVHEEPQTLKFKENPHFKIEPMEITTKSKGKHNLKDYVTIQCLEEFSTDQEIEVYAITKDKDGQETEQLAGKLYIWANDASKRKTSKVLLVNIKTPPISDAIEKQGNFLGQKELFEKYLQQALIEIDVETYSLDLSDDINLQSGGKYIEGSTILAYYEKDIHIPAAHATGYLNLVYYINAKLKESLKANGENEYKYSKYFVAFYLGEKGGKKDKYNIYQGLNGYASGDFVILFSGKSNETAAHEFLHTKGLPHSFTNKVADANAEYTYIYGKTENVMDYSHLNGNLRYCLWKWQWQKANSKITNL